MISDHKKPIIAYRVELEKKIQINKSFSERRNQAVALRILSYGLFGQKRYQNLYLTCSLNCFHLALKIANTIHQRVAGLAMIIKFETVQVLEYYAEQFNGKYFEEKKFSKITIKLTKNPTEDDKKEAGFNPGLSMDEIDEPLTEYKKQNNIVFQREKAKKILNSIINSLRNSYLRIKTKKEMKKYEIFLTEGYRDENPSLKKKERRSQRYHENEEDYRRGEKRTRGGGNMNRRTEDRRGNDQRENRGKRIPRRGRYDDDDD